MRPTPIHHHLTVLSLLAGSISLAGAEPGPAQPVDLMPRPEDHTSMWWREGFPGVVEGVPWHRCIETGHYGLVLDTETLAIPHFGPVANGDSLDALPPADLALLLTVDGKTYRATAGGPWSRHGGPRLIESGRFFQRADVTDLVFTADDGVKLNVEARFETAAWPDRLSLILAARPGRLPIPPGEESFGRVRGGFGLDGTNHFEVPAEDLADSEKFTLEFWVFLPADYQASLVSPWLVCKNHHEQSDGNFGIVIQNGAVPQARINLGGGRENAHTLEPDRRLPLNLEAWNHLAVSYDGDALRLYTNGSLAGEKAIGRKRTPVPGGLTFGQRGDKSGDGYRFRGVIDEIRLYDRALPLEELRLRHGKPETPQPELKPAGEWTFRGDGRASMEKQSERWNDTAMEIGLTTPKGAWQQRWDLTNEQIWEAPEWHQVALAIDPVAFETAMPADPIIVAASEVRTGDARPVDYDPVLGWHRVNLDGIEPIVSRRDAEAQREERIQKNSAGSGALPEPSDVSNDALERVRLVLSNPTDREQVARLMFEKTARGIRQRIGAPITGISAILRDPDGHPTGIPVQLSKNWHNDPKGGVYAGQWFHGISQVRLPAATTIELELTLAYGHWGGVPSASHAQLSLIGWGSNQRWDQSALGSWGESICYEPDQVQRGGTIMDVRPMMVTSMNDGRPWGWTNNVGGGDFFRLFDPAGQRIPHAAMRTTYHRHGPCVTEVTYAGRIGGAITHSMTVSLGRTNDIVRGAYQIRLDVNEPVEFSRFVIFQIGADNYTSTAERKMALGNETGLLKEWDTRWGGDIYRTETIEATGRIPWISLHDATSLSEKAGSGALANRGIVIRKWKARLGGGESTPWVAERGLNVGKGVSSTLDLLPPPGVTRLEPGDFVEATLEHVVVPQFAKDYYGPSEALRTALAQDENTWRLIHREATGNDRKIEMTTGTLERTFPDIRIRAHGNEARFQLTGGLGHVPITFTGLSSPKRYQLLVDEEALDQGIHGNDFWQTDYDSATRTWSRTYNLGCGSDQAREIRFLPVP